MKVKVTEQGLIIPKELLEGIQEFEIRKENHHFVLIPIEAADLIEPLDTQIPSELEDAVSHQTRPLSDYLGLLKDSPNFNEDPVEIQRRMRDEWS